MTATTLDFAWWDSQAPGRFRWHYFFFLFLLVYMLVYVAALPGSLLITVLATQDAHLQTPKCFFLEIYFFAYMSILFALCLCDRNGHQTEEGSRSHYRRLWATMWLLGIEFRISGRTVGALNRWAISLAPGFYSYWTEKVRNRGKYWFSNWFLIVSIKEEETNFWVKGKRWDFQVPGRGGRRTDSRRE